MVMVPGVMQSSVMESVYTNIKNNMKEPQTSQTGTTTFQHDSVASLVLLKLDQQQVHKYIKPWIHDPFGIIEDNNNIDCKTDDTKGTGPKISLPEYSRILALDNKHHVVDNLVNHNQTRKPIGEEFVGVISSEGHHYDHVVAVMPPSLTQPSEKECRGSNENETEEINIEKTFYINQYILRQDYQPCVIENLNGICEPQYTCATCSEAFYLASGLISHLRRKVIQIHITCNSCVKSLKVFYNCCSLLQHFASHGTTDLTEEKLLQDDTVSFTQLSTYSDNLLRVDHTADETELDDTELLCAQIIEHDNSATNDDIESGIWSPNNTAEANGLEHGNQGIQHSVFWCAICQVDFVNAQLFYFHLEKEENQRVNNHTNYEATEVRVCCSNMCSFPAVSLCAAVFHKRLCHQKKEPFLCPECGFNVDQQSTEWNFLYNHMRNDCFHFSKVVQYNCNVRTFPEHLGLKNSKCAFQSGNISDFIRHYSSNHVNLIYTCSLCSMTFSNKYLWLKHLWLKHSFSKKNYFDANKKLICQMQCECCLEMLAPEQHEAFEMHLQDHLLLNVNKHLSSKIMFICDMCSTLFKSSDDLKIHKKQSCVEEVTTIDLLSESSLITVDKQKSKKWTTRFPNAGITAPVPLQKVPTSLKSIDQLHKKPKAKFNRKRIQPRRIPLLSNPLLLSWNCLQERLQQRAAYTVQKTTAP